MINSQLALFPIVFKKVLHIYSYFICAILPAILLHSIFPMKLTPIKTVLLLSLLPSSAVFAGGLDRSGQSISAFLQPGNYFEAGVAVVDPSVSGQDKSGHTAPDMAESYAFPTAALKIQATDKISLGLLYDQPYGADSAYNGDNSFVAQPTDRLLENNPALTAQAIGADISGGTTVEVKTQNLAMLMGYQPNEQWNLYAGPVYQTVDGTVRLRGEVYSLLNGYDLITGEDGAWGWLAGVAYQIPEIALKASITYRSEVKHKISAQENFAFDTPTLNYLDQTMGLGLGLNAINNAQGTFSLSTPQSVNIDLQTGIMENTIAFANLRWVNWSNFVVRPYEFDLLTRKIGGIKPELNKPNGFNLIDYKDDQISATVGVGRKFSDQWAANVSVGYDSGAGNPVTTLGPTEGYWSVGTGVRFSPAKNYSIGAGVKYFWLGDADAVTGAHTEAGKFSNNHAIGYGLNIGYSF